MAAIGGETQGAGRRPGRGRAPVRRLGCAAVAAAICLLRAAGIDAGDGPAVRAGDARKAFDAASDARGRRKALEPLAGMPAQGRGRLLREWALAHQDSPQTVAVLARAMAEAEPEHVMDRLRSLAAERGLRLCVPALLRIALDVPGVLAQDLAALVPDKKASPVEEALIALAGAGTATQAPRPQGRYGAHFALHALVAGEAQTPPDWVEVGRLLADRGEADGAWNARLADGIVRRLPAPTVEQARGLPAWALEKWRDSGPPAFLAAWLATAPADSVAAYAATLRGRTVPSDVIEALVSAFSGMRADTPAQWSVHAVLLGLAGIDVPPDADTWRSWWAGHRDQVRIGGSLPCRATIPAAIASAVGFLLGEQRRSGAWLYADTFFAGAGAVFAGGRGLGIASGSQGSEHAGATALVLLALRAAGMSPTEKPIQHGLDALAHDYDPLGGDSTSGYTYAVALKAMALNAIGGKAQAEAVRPLASVLADGQSRKTGGWTYYASRYAGSSDPGSIDLSNTQYAILALREAERAGVPVPDDVWRRVLDLMHHAEQGTTGEWNYWYPTPADSFQGNRGGMAAIAACSLLIARARLEKGLRIEDALSDAAVDRALRSVAGKYGAAERYADLDLYTMYSVERVGALFGIAAFDGVPWYSAAAGALLARQNGDGSWGDDLSDWQRTWGRVVDTAYALLVLRRATTPIFSGGLDVPSDPAIPVHPFKGAPQALEGSGVAPPPAPADGSPPAPPDPAPSGDRSRDRAPDVVRVALRSALYEALLTASTPADRLAAAIVARRVDPLDPLWRLLCAEVLDEAGEWGIDGRLLAACPAPPTLAEVDRRQAALWKRVTGLVEAEAARVPAGSEEKAGLDAWLAGRSAPDGDRWDDAAVRWLAEDTTLRTLGGEATIEEGSPFEAVTGVPMVGVRTPRVWIDLETGLLDPVEVVHEVRVCERLIAALLGGAGDDSAGLAPLRLVVVDGRWKRNDPTKAPLARLDGGHCRDVRALAPKKPGLARLAILDAVAGAGLDVRTPRDARRDAPFLASLREIVIHVAAYGEAPRRAKGAHVSADRVDARLSDLLEVGARPAVEEPPPKDAPPKEAPPTWLRAADDAIVRWLLLDRRGGGVSVVRRILRGDPATDVCVDWPDGRDGFLRDLHALLR